MEPPAGAAPALFLYKRNSQPAAWRRNGAPTRNRTGLARLPSECIAGNALGTEEVRSWESRVRNEGIRGHHSPILNSSFLTPNSPLGWLVRASGNAPEPGTDLVRCGV
jgi:hypothetical protein